MCKEYNLIPIWKAVYRCLVPVCYHTLKFMKTMARNPKIIIGLQYHQHIIAASSLQYIGLRVGVEIKDGEEA